MTQAESIQKTGSRSRFENSLEHLLAELERIDLMIQCAVHRARRLRATDHGFEGLCINEEEVDRLLAEPCGLPGWAKDDPAPDGTSIQEHLAQARAAIEQRKSETLAAGTRLRLVDLENLFQLDDFDLDALLVCLAPELDLRYEKLYAYLQDDVTRKRPTVDLILNLLCPTLDGKIQARDHFLCASNLIAHQLLQLFADPSQPEPPLLRRYCKLDDRIVNYLLEQDHLAEPLLPFASFRRTEIAFDEVALPADLKQRMPAFLKHALENGRRTVFYFQGMHGAGKLAAAEALCRAAGCELLVVDGRQMLEKAGARFSDLILLAAREARLCRAAIYWRDFDRLLEPDKVSLLNDFVHKLDLASPLTFLAGQAAWEPDGSQFAGNAFVRIEFPAPKEQDRLVIWDRLLPPGRRSPEVDLPTVSTRFRLNPGGIEAAARTAGNLADWREPVRPVVTTGDLFNACRLQSHHKLAGLARKLEPKYGLADIVLPPMQSEQLQEILAQARLRHLVLGEWGFDRKLSLGKGLNVLFAGPPGTGKTMAAEVIASELGLDLYRIDLSQVVSKYIGETEKNLDRIFREACGSNAILFFDEADSLFGKRSEVKDAHDRYANIEIGYLLQKMEEYEGIAILATNLHQNLDDAFLRRLQVVVEFPFPDEEHRCRIWQAAFPQETPLGPDVDLKALARNVKLAGGNIKNIALAAAFRAAGNGRVITMSHLVVAAQREHQKLGRIWTEMETGTRTLHPQL